MITVEGTELVPGSVASFTPSDGWTVRFTGEDDAVIEQIIGWAVVVQEPRELDPDGLIETRVEPILLIGSEAIPLSVHRERNLGHGWRGGVAIRHEGSQA